MYLSPFVSENVTRPLVVLTGNPTFFLEKSLKNVRERTMPHVMEKRGDLYRFTLAIQFRANSRVIPVTVEQFPNDSPGEIEDAQRVCETRVLRARVDKMGNTKLPYAPQALEFLRINESKYPTVFGSQIDQVVDWITKDLGPLPCFRCGMCACISHDEAFLPRLLARVNPHKYDATR